jgi:hypothetical protein
MAVASSYRETSGQVRERARPPSLVATLQGAHWRDRHRLRWRKEEATAGQHAPKPLGRTRAAMAGTMGFDPVRGKQSSKPASVGIEGCNPPS